MVSSFEHLTLLCNRMNYCFKRRATVLNAEFILTDFTHDLL